MIRINLLPQKDQKKGKRPGTPMQAPGSNALLGVFFLCALLELGGLYYWYMLVTESEEGARKHQKELADEKTRLEEIAKQGSELDTLRKDVAAQRVVFAELENGRTGPLNALLFLSYALQRVDTTTAEEEYRVLTDLWTPERLKRTGSADSEWDPRSVWVQSIAEVDGEVTINGRARNHEDVMTFMKRLRTAIYFDGVDFVSQTKVLSSQLGVELIEFKLSAFLNYDERGYPPTPPPPT